jgi:uncharacterized protein (DUF1015 family)
MSVIRPFKAVRPALDKAHLIAALPYDVMNTQEAREMVKGNPLSFLHVDKSEIDLPVDTHLYDESVYQKARENLYGLITDGHLIQDQKPSLYLYMQVMDGRSQVGVVCCASISEYENNLIKKHEHTRAEKEADRIKHVDTTDAQTGPIFLTYRSIDTIEKKTNEIMKSKPIYDFVAEDDVRHVAWLIDSQSDIDFFVESFATIPSLYIADGHHRCASACKVGQKRRDANPNHTGNEEYNYFLAVIFPDTQLEIMDYNRVIKDMNGVSRDEFLSKVAQNFTIEELAEGIPFKPTEPHTFGMYPPCKKWHKLTAKSGSFPENHPVDSLDVSILQKNLLAPILAIGDPRTDDRIDFVGGIRGIAELEKRINEGEAIAFAMYPTSIAQLMAIADASEVMPPKSTWFEPKLRSGLFIHLLS